MMPTQQASDSISSVTGRTSEAFIPAVLFRPPGRHAHARVDAPRAAFTGPRQARVGEADQRDRDVDRDEHQYPDADGVTHADSPPRVRKRRVHPGTREI